MSTHLTPQKRPCVSFALQNSLLNYSHCYVPCCSKICNVLIRQTHIHLRLCINFSWSLYWIFARASCDGWIFRAEKIGAPVVINKHSINGRRAERLCVGKSGARKRKRVEKHVSGRSDQEKERKKIKSLTVDERM